MEMGMVHDDVFFVPLPPVRRCFYPGCRTVLAQSNGAELCYRHREAERQHDLAKDRAAERVGSPVPKFKKMCLRRRCYVRLEQGNTSGYCIHHAVAVNE